MCQACQLVVISFCLFVRTRCQGDCGQSLTALEGTFSSPHYPGNYPNNQQCIYSITVPPGHRVTVTFHNFHLEGLDSANNCPDFVEVHDGDSRLAALMVQYFCGQGYVGPTTDLRSTGRHMWIRFMSDGKNTFPGFNASYSTDTKGDNFALVADSTFHNVYNLDMFTLSFVNISVPHLYHPTAIGYDAYTRPVRIFWIESGGNVIYSAFVDGSDKQVVVSLGHDAKLEVIAVDASSNIIFYSDSGNDVIGVTSVATGSYKHVISKAFVKIHHIALDKKAGLVLWTDGTVIQRCTYSGEDRRTLVTVPATVQLLSITFNTQAKTLMWLSKSADGELSIESCDVSGRDRTLVYNTHTDVYNLVRIVFYDLRLYLVRLNVGRHEHSSELLWLSRIEPEYLWKAHNYRIEDVVFYKESLKKEDSTRCREDNGGCSHICIPLAGNQTRCMCPERHVLAENGLSCRLPSPDPTRCREDNGGCSHICIPLPGNQTRCMCPEGHVLGENKLSCRQPSPEDDNNEPTIIGSVVGSVCAVITVVVVVVVVVFVKRRMAGAPRGTTGGRGSRESGESRYDTIHAFNASTNTTPTPGATNNTPGGNVCRNDGDPILHVYNRSISTTYSSGSAYTSSTTYDEVNPLDSMRNGDQDTRLKELYGGRHLSPHSPHQLAGAASQREREDSHGYLSLHGDSSQS